MPYVVAGVVAVVVLGWIIGNYNGLVRIRNHCNESWADIETELKRRHDLVPQLVATVRGYANHEERVLGSVTEARRRAVRAREQGEGLAQEENNLVRSVGGLFALAENYPDLKADQHFARLQSELVNTEDRIQASRRIFNANVRDLNTRIESFPVSVVASAFRFEAREFFEIDSIAERVVPDVRL